jgi:hypothetical protein
MLVPLLVDWSEVLSIYAKVKERIQSDHLFWCTSTVYPIGSLFSADGLLQFLERKRCYGFHSEKEERKTVLRAPYFDMLSMIQI